MDGTGNTKRKPFDDPIGKEDVKVVVKQALGPNFKIVNYHIRTYSQERLGFLGDHRHLIVTAQPEGSTEKAIHTFFLKSIPYDNEVQASLTLDCNAFYKETHFYQLIVPELMKSVKDKSWLAQCYLVKNDALVFEDLKSKNFNLRGQLLEMDAVKSALAALAKLHASSMLAEKRIGKRFIELHPEILKECLFTRTNKFREWIKSGVDLSVRLAETLNLNSSKIYLACEQIFDLLSTSKTRKNVICHGDAKSFNLMFNDAKPLPKCMLVDFQLARYTCPTSDILQLLYLTTRRAYREKYEKDLLIYYTQALADVLKEEDLDIKIPTNREIIEEYEENRLIGIVTAALYGPGTFMDTLKCAELTKDSDGFEKMLCGDRLSLILEIMQQDAFYNEIITEIVEELSEKSQKLI